MIDLESLKELTCTQKDCINQQCEGLRKLIPEYEKLLDLTRRVRDAQKFLKYARIPTTPGYFEKVEELGKLESELDALLSPTKTFTSS